MVPARRKKLAYGPQCTGAEGQTNQVFDPLLDGGPNPVSFPENTASCCVHVTNDVGSHVTVLQADGEAMYGCYVVGGRTHL